MLKKLLAIALAIIVAALLHWHLAVSASAATIDLESTTRSILLIDCSGSMEDRESVDQIVNGLNTKDFDFVGYFSDGQISLKPLESGNSHICETLDNVVKLGFTHISIVTDAEQWPADYSALGVYTDLDVELLLTENTEASETFVEELQARMVHSNLKVITDGTTEVVLNDYQAPSWDVPECECPPVVIDDTSADTSVEENPEDASEDTSEVSDEPTESEDTSEDLEVEVKVVQNHWQSEHDHCWICWIALILSIIAILLALLALLSRLFGRRNGLPKDAIDKIAAGAHPVLDISASMDSLKNKLIRTCKKLKYQDNVTCFADNAYKVAADDLSSIRTGGQTRLYEALESVSAEGQEEIVLLSDLKANGKPFDENGFANRFKKITVVAPADYDRQTLANLEKIADDVELSISF